MHHKGDKPDECCAQLDQQVALIDPGAASPAPASDHYIREYWNELEGPERLAAGIAARAASDGGVPPRPAHQQHRKEAADDRAQAEAHQPARRNRHGD
jgi:hypothetical protein